MEAGRKRRRVRVDNPCQDGHSSQPPQSDHRFVGKRGRYISQAASPNDAAGPSQFGENSVPSFCGRRGAIASGHSEPGPSQLQQDPLPPLRNRRPNNPSFPFSEVHQPDLFGFEQSVVPSLHNRHQHNHSRHPLLQISANILFTDFGTSLSLASSVHALYTIPDAEKELAENSGLEVCDAAMSWVYKGTLLLRSTREKMESQASEFAVKEKKYLEQIKALQDDVAKKELERGEAVDSYYKLQSDLGIRLEKTEAALKDLDQKYNDLEKERKYLEKKIAEKDQLFLNKCNRIWELCNIAYEKVGAKPEEPCWELGEFDPFFSWLCRQYDDLPSVVHNSADTGCMYSTRALFHLLREAKDPLYDQLLNPSYRLPEASTLLNVSSTTNQLCKKFFHEFWNKGGRDHCFAKTKERMEKQYKERLRAVEAEEKRQEEARKRSQGGEVGPHRR